MFPTPSLPPAYAETTTTPSWAAEWIGSKEPSHINQWTCYRKTFSLDEVPSIALTRIAVDSKYWLWVNGELIIFEGQLKRGPTPTDTYFDHIDIAKALHPGSNTIAILNWYFGKNGFSHKSSGKSALLFETDLGEKKILSDQSWKMMEHPAYEQTEAPYPNYRLPESNIRFNALNDIPEWISPEYNDHSWENASLLGKPPCPPWNHLIERNIPQWKDFGRKPYTNHESLPLISEGTTIEAILPYNAQITPYLKIDAPAGLTIDIRTDNYMGGGEPNVRAEYITREGIQEYESLGWMNGHAVLYSIPKGIKILGLEYRETGYNTEFTGTFECSDPFLNRLREKSLRTLYITMRDTYFDCPDRERAQWWGDVVNELGEAFYALDTQSNLLTRKAILELAHWQKENGSLFSPVPAGNWAGELPMQMLNSIGWFGFWTYYLYTGDKETIQAVYPQVKRYLECWELGDDGLVIDRKGDWPWSDWGEQKDVPVMLNAWFYLALKGQREMAKLLEQHKDIPFIETRIQSIRENFNRHFWTGHAYRSPSYKGETDDRGHGLAVLSGLATPEQYPAIRKVLQSQRHSSPYMEKYVLESLYQMGFENDALERIHDRYQKSVDHEYSTLWEGWGIGSEGFGGGTINHAWSGGPLTLMSQYITGIAPTAPGYKHYHVRPQLGSLEYARATVTTVRGEISVRIEQTDTSFNLRLQSPETTQALVAIPSVINGKTIREIKNGAQLIWSPDQALSLNETIQFNGQNEQWIEFIVSPGVWNFQASF